MRIRLATLAACVAIIGWGGAAARAQAPSAPAPITFQAAVNRALQRNPSVEQAAADILRAQALLGQARSAILPGVNGSAVDTTLSRENGFAGNVTAPRNQVVASLTVSQLLFAPVQWALRAQAAENVRVSEASAGEVRRQVALAAAQAYLAVIARGRVLEADRRARDVAQAHYDLARQQRELGSGSRLNELRAQQSLSSDEALVEQSALDLLRAQEALGILLALDAPAAAADEPVLEPPADLTAATARLFDARADVRAAAARERAAGRVVRDSWKDYLPSVTGLFQPQFVQPETLFQQRWTWRAQVVATVPIFDSGFRAARKAEREAVLQQARVQLGAVGRQARSDVRRAEESVRRAQAALGSARAAAQQAAQVVDIVNVSFRAGAATNIEVIDAQRTALDADTAAAVAEDQLRQARLALLLALGLFPG